MSSSLPPRTVIGLIVSLLVIIAFVDAVTPLGYAVPLLYSLPLFLTLWLPMRLSPIWVAITCTILTIAGYVLTPSGGVPLHGMVNRIMTVAAGWGIAWLILHFKARHLSLLQSEERFQRMFTDAVIPMAVLDREKRFVQVNRAFCAWIGYEAHELLGTTYAVLTHPNDPSGHLACIDQVLAGHLPRYESETRYRRKDNTLLWVSESVGRITLPGYDQPLILWAVRDITERKRADTKLRGLMEAAPDATVIVNAEGRILRLNVQAERLFGYTRQELLGQPVELMIPERFRRRHPDQREGYFAAPTVRAMGAGRELFGRRKDGAEFPVEISLSPLETDEGLLVIGAIRDITERKRVEEKLFRASALMNTVFEASPIGIATTDAEGCLTSWSPALERLFGWSEQEVLGQQSRIIPPGKESEADDLWERVMKGESLRGVEVQRCRKDGTLVDVQIWGGALRDSSGKVVGTAGVVADIGARKAAEAAVVRSNDLMQSFIEHTPAAIAMLDRDLRYVAVSRRWLQDYRLGDQGIIGKHHYDIFPEIRAMQEWQAVHQRCLAGAVERREEDRFVRVDGAEEWLRWEVRPWRDVTGAIGGIIMFTEVITARKQAEAALRESEERFRLAFEMAPTGMALSTADGVFSRVNHRFCEMLGYPERELIGLSFAAVTHPEDLPRNRQGLAALATGKISVYIDENRYLHKDGQVIWGVVTLSIIRDEARGPIYALAQVQDVTMLRQAEAELRQAMEVRDRIGRDLHDGILQSLYAVGLTLESSRESMTTQPRQGEALVDRAMRQLADVMGEVRHFIGTLETSSCAPTDWADAARSLVESQAAIYRVTSEVLIDPDAVRSLSPQVGVHLINIVRESVSNSLRHGRPSRLTVQLTHDGNRTRLRIRDDGMGFRPMSVAKGGHGLRNMRARSDSLGADFKIVSELGVGTEVVVELRT